MAIRNIRVLGEKVLSKPCRPVDKMTEKNLTLIEDMFDTMYETGGVGLAAPQVGVLKRIAVIDLGTEKPEPLVLINPVITETSGEQTGGEGCLSVPGKHGLVTRPNYVKVRALDENMKEYELEAEGLLARAICHECEHLDGIIYTAHVIGELKDISEPLEGEDTKEEPENGEVED